MKKLTESLVYAVFFSSVYAQTITKSVEINDFTNLIGCRDGSLTYLDYASNKPFSMPAQMILKD